MPGYLRLSQELTPFFWSFIFEQTDGVNEAIRSLYCHHISFLQATDQKNLRTQSRLRKKFLGCPLPSPLAISVSTMSGRPSTSSVSLRPVPFLGVRPAVALARGRSRGAR